MVAAPSSVGSTFTFAYMARRGSSLLSAALCCCLLCLCWQLAEGTIIYVHNQCGSTSCAKYFVPNLGGACQELGSGATWTVTASSSWVGGVMWVIPNTGCSGQACNTGPPSGVTLFEISVNSNGGHDFYDISALSGFNVALKVVPTSTEGGACQTVDCQGNSAAACPNGYYTGNPNDETKACTTGTNYDLYLCT